MDIKRCNFCLKPFDWYDGINDNGRYVKTNSIRFTHTLPLEIGNNGVPKAIEEDDVDNDLNMYIDVCPECMKKILKGVHTDTNNTAL